jgi:hypothetical protein
MPAFVHDVTNPWFPLRPGMQWVYGGVKDGRATTDVVTVKSRRRVVDGVSCVIVSDVLSVHGHPIEKTHDWYAQDTRGNVWYFGEATAEYDTHGRLLTREGSWRSGRHGARAGLFMPARPRIGAGYAQEHFPGVAEDHFTIAGFGIHVHVAAGRFGDAMLTLEYTPVEPGVVDAKYYVKGMGVVLETTLVGPRERNALLRFTG